MQLLVQPLSSTNLIPRVRFTSVSPCTWWCQASHGRKGDNLCWWRYTNTKRMLLVDSQTQLSSLKTNTMSQNAIFSSYLLENKRLTSALMLSSPMILRRFLLLSKIEHVANLCQITIQATSQIYTCRVHSLTHASSRLFLPLLHILAPSSWAVPSNSEPVKKTFCFSLHRLNCMALAYLVKVPWERARRLGV